MSNSGEFKQINGGSVEPKLVRKPVVIPSLSEKDVRRILAAPKPAPLILPETNGVEAIY